MSMSEERGDRRKFVDLSDVQRLEQFSDLKRMPATLDVEHLTAADVLKVLTVALAGTRDADGVAKLRAQAVVEEAYARGRRAALQDGRREGYHVGYCEGLEDGRREVLDQRAREEAERVSLKAGALARRDGWGKPPSHT